MNRNVLIGPRVRRSADGADRAGTDLPNGGLPARP